MAENKIVSETESSVQSVLSAAEAKGYAVLLETCAEVLLNEPTNPVLDDLKRVAQAAGDASFDGIEPDKALTQRYYDRFFVSATPYYVPLREEHVAGMYEEEGHLRFASSNGSKVTAVLKCYREAGFSVDRLTGYKMALQTLKADSLAAETAFLSYLCHACALEAEQGTPEGNERANAYATMIQQFITWHASTWFDKAARALARTQDDLYARVARLAADAVAELKSRLTVRVR